MSVLIFIDTTDGHVKKSSLEVLTYGAKVAEQLGTVAEGVVLGSVTEDLAALGKYGVKKIHQVSNDALKNLDAQVYANVIAQVAQASGATVIVFSNSSPTIGPVESRACFRCGCIARHQQCPPG